MAGTIQVTGSPGDGHGPHRHVRSDHVLSRACCRTSEGSVVSHRQSEQRRLSSRHEIGKQVVQSVTGVHHVLNAPARQEPHGIAEVNHSTASILPGRIGCWPGKVRRMLIGTRRAQSDRPVAVIAEKLNVQRRQGALRRRTGAICGNLKGWPNSRHARRACFDDENRTDRSPHSHSAA